MISDDQMMIHTLGVLTHKLVTGRFPLLFLPQGNNETPKVHFELALLWEQKFFSIFKQTLFAERPAAIDARCLLSLLWLKYSVAVDDLVMVDGA